MSVNRVLFCCVERMSSNFLNQWDLSHSVIRDEEEADNFDYSLDSGSFGNDSWNWSSDPVNGRPSLLFDFNDTLSFKHHSEPVSPSSVETTPTTSEQPISVSSHQEVHRISTSGLPKRQRKSSAQDRIDRNGRKKKYDAPPGVWRNSGGFISTVYINKKRVYGPLRRDVADAVRDREEMLEAKVVIHTEEGMRAFVHGMKERCANLSAAQRSALVSRSERTEVRRAPAPVRVSSRPVRSASKRSVLAFSDDDSSFDDTPMSPAAFI